MQFSKLCFHMSDMNNLPFLRHSKAQIHSSVKAIKIFGINKRIPSFAKTFGPRA